MNAIVKNLVFTYGVDLVLDILGDMISLEGVIEFRSKVIAMGVKITGKTETELDDRAWKYVVEHILTPDGWANYGAEFFGWAKRYVINSATKYDDFSWSLLVRLEAAFKDMAAAEDHIVAET